MKTAEQIKSEDQVKAENKMLAALIHAQSRLSTLVHAGWHEFSEESKSIEKKMHTLWVESGREDAPTFDLGVWAQEQGMDFTSIFM